MIKRALISVSHKEGLVPFAKELASLGVDIISTGGTLKVLQAAQIPARSVTELTKFPEMMDGRVKTLHPMIHGGILALRQEASHREAMERHHIEPIDLVVVNLYPFRETIAKEGVTLEEAIEQIDIGGPSMVRAAAKNWNHVAIVVNPQRYEDVLQEIKAHGEVQKETRFALCKEAFAHTAAYDMTIVSYLESLDREGFGDHFFGVFEKIQDLRYGENPHQKAAFYKDLNEASGLGQLKQLHGKELSYNNIVDMEAAWNMVWEFEEPAACIIKHTNPCGAATGDTISDAYEKAFAADSVSAFGGIVALNRELDEKTAKAMSEVFLEVVMAPSFSQKALALIMAKKNIRLITLEAPSGHGYVLKKVSGGLLVQTEDALKEEEGAYEIVTEREPTEEEWKGLRFAWKLVKHVKSNAILISSEDQTLGVGAGQMNRVGAASIALAQAGSKAEGSVMASDAFFPFGDTVELAAAHGITAIIQPGGSLRDEESIAAANKHGIAMVFTKIRHFKH